MTNFVIGPIAPENNPTIEPDFYNPSRFNITAISMGQTTTVTTSVAHNYVVGQLIRLNIPPICRAEALNGQSALVISLPSTTQVTLNIPSINVSAFVSAPATGSKPQIVAIGDQNSGRINASGRTNIATSILGSFINVSPQ